MELIVNFMDIDIEISFNLILTYFIKFIIIKEEFIKPNFLKLSDMFPM